MARAVHESWRMQPTRMRWPLAGLIFIAVALAAVIALLALKWPFTRSAILKSLAEESQGQVSIGEFHQTFFPSPGCILRDIVIHHGSDRGMPPLITAERVTVTGSYSGLITFSKRLQQIHVEGMHIRIPRGESASDSNGTRPAGKSSGAMVSADRLIAERTVLEFAPKEANGEPFVMQIHRTVLAPASSTAAMSFEAALRIPEPPGEIEAKGSFGPWRKADAFETPVSGTYRFEHADLGKFHGIAGTLASTGQFQGVLQRIGVRGVTDVTGFEVEGTAHRLDLKAEFQARVDGRTGDVSLNKVDVKFLRTQVVSEGAVASPAPGDSKTVSLDMAVNRGLIQDLLRLVSSGPPGLSGSVNLRFKVQLPPGDAPFLQRLKLTGQMGVADAKFTKRETQEGLEHISFNAQHGEDNPADVVSDLKGRVSVANGVATLTGLTFNVPGASAAMSGTYHLITHRVDLHGQVRLQEKLSQTTTGIKSFLLKALDPFFRKRKHLSVVPIRITGEKGNTSIKLD